MAEELNLEHFDLGTFVDYVHALKQERDALLAQQSSQGGEAVAFIPVDRETGEHWPPQKHKGNGKICDYIPLYAHAQNTPADSRVVPVDLLELLERARDILAWMACRADICPEDLCRLEESAEELRALLEVKP